MELKTDGGIYLTKEDYRKLVIEIMQREKEACLAACLIQALENKIDPKVALEAGQDALKLQLDVLHEMEKKLFGKKKKEEPEEPQVSPKTDDVKKEDSPDV